VTGLAASVRRRRCAGPAAIALLAVVVGVGLSGCGVPASSAPEVLSAGLIPKALSASVRPIPPAQPPRGAIIAIYLLNIDDRLFAAPRNVLKVTPQSVLDALEQGPLSKEFAEGVTTELLPGSNLKVLAVTNGVAKVQLDSNFFDLIGEATVLELAQVVDTMTSAVPLKIHAVQFYFQGSPTEAEIGNGSLVSGPVTFKDYASLLE
jgi:hypothetical protein